MNWHDMFCFSYHAKQAHFQRADDVTYQLKPRAYILQMWFFCCRFFQLDVLCRQKFNKNVLTVAGQTVSG